MRADPQESIQVVTAAGARIGSVLGFDGVEQRAGIGGLHGAQQSSRRETHAGVP